MKSSATKFLWWGLPVSLICGSGTGAIAGDLLFRLTSETYQDAVAIGEVKSSSGNELIFRPTRVLLGDRLPKTIRVLTTEPQEQLQAGDAAVLPLTKKTQHYQLNSPAFEVSHTDPMRATIQSGPLNGADRYMFQRFINSCGGDRDFSFDGQSIYVKEFDPGDKQTGNDILIGVKEGEQWVPPPGPYVIVCRDNRPWWEVIWYAITRIFSG